MVSLPLHYEVYVGMSVVDEIKENGGRVQSVKGKMCRQRIDGKKIPLNPTISFHRAP